VDVSLDREAERASGFFQLAKAEGAEFLVLAFHQAEEDVFTIKLRRPEREAGVRGEELGIGDRFPAVAVLGVERRRLLPGLGKLGDELRARGQLLGHAG
jgi:hypothetical protein